MQTWIVSCSLPSPICQKYCEFLHENIFCAKWRHSYVCVCVCYTNNLINTSVLQSQQDTESNSSHDEVKMLVNEHKLIFIESVKCQIKCASQTANYPQLLDFNDARLSFYAFEDPHWHSLGLDVMLT